jgi:hypothetical protein
MDSNKTIENPIVPKGYEGFDGVLRWNSKLISEYGKLFNNLCKGKKSRFSEVNKKSK